MLLKLLGSDPETGDRLLASHRMSEAQTKRRVIPCARNCAGAGDAAVTKQKSSSYVPRAVILTVCFLSQQPQHHPRTCEKCEFSQRCSGCGPVF